LEQEAGRLGFPSLLMPFYRIVYTQTAEKDQDDRQQDGHTMTKAAVTCTVTPVINGRGRRGCRGVRRGHRGRGGVRLVAIDVVALYLDHHRLDCIALPALLGVRVGLSQLQEIEPIEPNITVSNSIGEEEVTGAGRTDLSAQDTLLAQLPFAVARTILRDRVERR